jgi:hypothetical protein
MFDREQTSSEIRWPILVGQQQPKALAAQSRHQNDWSSFKLLRK